MPAATPPPTPADSRQSWPLIGRAGELDDIGEALAGGGGVVIHAPAGVGKSRLARAALDAAARGGANTIWIQATRSVSTIPLGAFATVVPAEARSEDLFELLRHSAQALRELSSKRPLVVGVDDAHLLDPTSAALVLHLVSTATAKIVMSVRSGEQCADAIVSLWSDGTLRRLELSALNESATRELAESIVGGQIEERASRWIWETSNGNALYVRELTRSVLEGALAQERGLWRMTERPVISTSLAELIGARTTRIDDLEREALELLALGEPLELGRLVRLTSSQTLTSLEADSMITVENAQAVALVRLAHPLFSEVIRQSLPFLRGRELRLKLATEFERNGIVSGPESLRVVRWLLDAGEPAPPRVLVDAAQEAILSGDPQLGARLARDAVDSGVGLQATLVLARSYALRNQFEDAAAVLAAAEEDVDTPDGAVEYLEQELAVLYWGLQRTDDLRALLDRARDWWPDRAWKVRLAPIRLRAGLLTSLGDAGGQVAESGDLLAADDLDPVARRQLQVVQLAGLFHGGRGQEAYELGCEIRPELPLRDPTDEGILSLWIAVIAETGLGWPGLEAWAREALQTGVRQGDRGGAGLAALALGHLSFYRGRFREAGRWLAEAMTHHERHDPIGVMANTASLQAGVACYTGDAAGAQAALALCRTALRGERPLPFQLPAIASAQAWAAIAEGDVVRAEQLLLDAAVDLSTLPHYAARLTYEAMRAGTPARHLSAALTGLSERCNSPLVAARAAHAEHRARGDGPALLELVGEFEDIGTVLYASEAAAHAAEIFLEAGRQDSARRAAARSQELFPADQGGQPPAIRGLDPGAVELTRREAQLVKLARSGLSSPEIAERLVLSTRTVESHLYRAMQKLGVSDRRQL